IRHPRDPPSPATTASPGDGRGRPAAKRVTFPSDEDIVSGAVEPKDPWRHGEGTGDRQRGGGDREGIVRGQRGLRDREGTEGIEGDGRDCEGIEETRKG
ncbi:hypothetical protein HGM15179_021766, partial [Zosterops borbonicus]